MASADHPLPTRTAAVILAAGAGSRFSVGVAGHPDPALRFGPEASTAGGESAGSKLRVHWNGRPVITWAIDAAVQAGLDATFVVTGAAELDDLLPSGVIPVANPAWAAGQAGSLQAAISAARAGGFGAVVVGLGDQPGIPPDAWQAVAASPAAIAVATYQGRRRNPVRLAQEVWALLPTSGDVGARPVMAEHPELVAEVPCQGNPGDIDTVEDLRPWN
jgi:molybdenum cofactor cytidylyltransferase